MRVTNKELKRLKRILTRENKVKLRTVVVNRSIHKGKEESKTLTYEAR